MVTSSVVVQPGNPECQVRAEIMDGHAGAVLVLADGAGGIAGGAKAAEGLIQLVRAAANQLASADDCARLLLAIDSALAGRKECGETTGVVIVVSQHHIFGSSVGDSAAWLFAASGCGELTYGQSRKPLLGSGQVTRPRAFSWPVETGTLVVASDGLWKYADRDAIGSRVETRDSADLALRLAELARLPSGGFADDVAVVTYRIAEENGKS